MEGTVTTMTDDLVNKSGDLVKDLVNDCISRQKALNSPVKMVSDGLEWVHVYHLRELPSAQRWIPWEGEKP